MTKESQRKTQKLKHKKFKYIKKVSCIGFLGKRLDNYIKIS